MIYFFYMQAGFKKKYLQLQSSIQQLQNLIIAIMKINILFVLV